ncbi:MAG: hypothetical protein K2P81_03830 [Bacteriovoracaceae bacterium]|nr:hypothetical protein [Bacteriovoracaceae bacterium]
MALRNKKNLGWKDNKVLQTLIQPRVLPFTLTFSCMAVLFVTIRMKSIEQAYQLDGLANAMDKAIVENKEIKAQRARMLSVQRLREYAEKFNLKEPGPEQIILIP